MSCSKKSVVFTLFSVLFFVHRVGCWVSTSIVFPFLFFAWIAGCLDYSFVFLLWVEIVLGLRFLT